MLKLAIVVSHPIQYQVPLYRAIAARGDVDLKVFYCWKFGVEETRDPGFGRTIRWDVPLLGGYAHEFIPNVARDPGTHHFLGLVNPTALASVFRFRPDAMIVHGYAHLTEVTVMTAARAGGIPVLLRSDSSLVAFRAPWVRAAKRAVLPQLFRGLAGALTSGTLNAAYYRHYGVPEQRLFPAPFSVDNAFFRDRLEDIRADARTWRDELGIERDDLVALFAAKLTPVKGCADLIRAFAASARKGTHLVVVGDGPLRPELEALARSHPEASIRFVGFVNQRRMPVAYALGDVFVLPSRFEPWGLAVNEAMNLGLPIIASDQVGAVPDLVSDANGYVFPAGDVAALTRILRDALQNRDALREKGEASRRMIADWDVPQTAEGFVRAARAVARRS